MDSHAFFSKLVPEDVWTTDGYHIVDHFLVFKKRRRQRFLRQSTRPILQTCAPQGVYPERERLTLTRQISVLVKREAQSVDQPLTASQQHSMPSPASVTSMGIHKARIFSMKPMKPQFNSLPYHG